MRTRIMPFLGAVQVQITHSLFYLTLVNATMLALTFWSTAGVSLAAQYAPWMTAREFLICGAVVVVGVMLMDYKLVYPYRQAFLNEQTCKFSNPAMDELRACREELAAIRARLDAMDGVGG